MVSKTQLGSWVEHAGQLLLFLVFVVCMVDLYGFTDRGHLMVSLPIYLSSIFSGVALHIIASPIKAAGMNSTKKPKPKAIV